MLTSLLAHLSWNPDRVLFYIPFIHHPVVWYGALFAAGFLVTYLVLRRVFLVEIFSKMKLEPSHVLDWERLEKKVLKYSLQQECNLTDKVAILSEIQKKIKEKKLPFSFFDSKTFSIKKISDELTDQMTGYITLGLLTGARLGYVFFYGWPLFRQNWLEIFKIWSGGLASHGACTGILIALALLVRKFSKTKFNFGYLHLMDFLAIISAFFACFIRLGNFFNQEIIGLPSQMPWAIIFLNPFDGGAITPRHPVQLYEALFYLALACSMYFLWKKNKVPTGNGLYAGTFLIALFSFRFCVEFLKEPQGYVLPIFKGLLMGQYLSIPFILIGIGLIVRYRLQVKGRYKKSPL